MADPFRERKSSGGIFSMTPKDDALVPQKRPFILPKGGSPGRPTGIRAPHGARETEFSWPDGRKDRLTNRLLRGFCPCAGCQGHSGEIRFQDGRNSELRDLKPVGNYALSLVWGDAHDSGIYSFEYLYQLGTLVAEWGEDELIELGTLPRGRVVAAAGE
jgi:DUF971 family protein